MNILFVHNVGDLYGASRSLLRLSGALAKDGHRVHVILPEPGPLAEALQERGAEVVMQPGLTMITRQNSRTLSGLLRLALGLVPSVMAICSVIRRANVQLVHTNTALILSPGLAALLSRRPHIWHIREFFTDYPRLWPYHQVLMKALSARVIAVSEAVAQQFRSPSGISVIPNGFPREEFDSVPPEHGDIFRKRFGFQQEVLVAVVGRIKWRRKGQEVLVAAASLIRDQFPNVRFVLIGSPFPGNEEHLVRLQDLIRELNLADRVTITGDIADIKGAYRGIDISVLTSVDPEPFGGVVIEAMAMGKPVIGTRIGGTTEQIADGVTGLLVAPGDAEQLADALRKLIAAPDLREAMGRCGRSRFLERFEFAPFYARITELYRQLVTGGAIA